jgi:hypothetical protein
MELPAKLRVSTLKLHGPMLRRTTEGSGRRGRHWVAKALSSVSNEANCMPSIKPASQSATPAAPVKLRALIIAPSRAIAP